MFLASFIPGCLHLANNTATATVGKLSTAEATKG